MLNQTKPGLWENTNNVLEQLREDLSRAKRLDFGNFVTEIQREIDWLEFFDAETTPTIHKSKRANIEANTTRNNYHDAADSYDRFLYGETVLNGETEKAAHYAKMAYDFRYMAFILCEAK